MFYNMQSMYMVSLDSYNLGNYSHGIVCLTHRIDLRYYKSIVLIPLVFFLGLCCNPIAILRIENDIVALEDRELEP